MKIIHLWVDCEKVQALTLCRNNTLCNIHSCQIIENLHWHLNVSDIGLICACACTVYMWVFCECLIEVWEQRATGPQLSGAPTWRCGCDAGRSVLLCSFCFAVKCLTCIRVITEGRQSQLIQAGIFFLSRKFMIDAPEMIIICASGFTFYVHTCQRASHLRLRREGPVNDKEEDMSSWWSVCLMSNAYPLYAELWFVWNM